jgi:dTDP-4-amino-4,6-dideoxygalactose transaminase
VKVPFVDLSIQHRQVGARILAAWKRGLDDSGFILGRRVEEFEAAFARYCRVRHAVGVADGTDALALALRACGIGPGDEVVTAVNTFVATAEAIVHSGARPVFVDQHPDTFQIDVRKIELRLTPRTRAILPVHLYGRPADMDPIRRIARRRKLKVIEDAAHAHGALYRGRKAGSMGDAGCFSFYPGKNLGACGDAGAIVTDDESVAQVARELRNHGGTQKYRHERVGYNSRLDALHAAALSIKLERLDSWNRQRQAVARRFDRKLSGIRGIIPPPHAERDIISVYHLYVIRVQGDRRDALIGFLKDRGVEAGIHYPTPIHLLPAFRWLGIGKGEYPVAERVSGEILSLPIYPGMTRDQVDHVARCVREFADARS